jgi:uncharacterized protein YqgQ
METYKVYEFILKSKKEPYAYTIEKKLRDDFISQRNPNLFLMKTVKMNKYEYMAFISQNQKQMLIEIPLSTSLKDYVYIVATYKEEDELSYEMEKMENELADIYRHLVLQSNIKTKYKDSVNYLTCTFILNEDLDSLSRVNSFAVFYKLFKDTFQKPNQEDE